jgi:fumarate reductase subunit D
MTKSNKPLVWGLFAAGGTLAAFLAPVLVLLFVLVALGHPPTAMAYVNVHALVGHWVAKLLLFATIALFLWHAAHRLRVTLHDLGVRQDPSVAIVVYTIAAAGSVLSVWYLLRI